jgi:hypothetical protein
MNKYDKDIAVSFKDGLTGKKMQLKIILVEHISLKLKKNTNVMI